MKAAFSHWDNRIAPVFDTARQIRLIEAEGGGIVSQTEELLTDDYPVRKIQRLVELGVGTLVCGAISRPMHDMAAAYGMRVFSFVAGDLDQVIRAWSLGGLERDAFAMPGCRGRDRRRYLATQGMSQEGFLMDGQGRGMGMGGGRGGGMGQGRGGGIGQGRGAGQGRRGQGRGRMGGPLAAGATGDCVCPKCGHREPHQRGVPCMQRQCPQCGTLMTRE
ncbi:MAG: hypothetical protein JW952_06515 [Candidatus Eisenbacteria bacterium]|nr:hypothetical protein [Candidatus Eisenbacteria bacterium]